MTENGKNWKHRSRTTGTVLVFTVSENLSSNFADDLWTYMCEQCGCYFPDMAMQRSCVNKKLLNHFGEKPDCKKLSRNSLSPPPYMENKLRQHRKLVTLHREPLMCLRDKDIFYGWPIPELRFTKRLSKNSTFVSNKQRPEIISWHEHQPQQSICRERHLHSSHRFRKLLWCWIVNALLPRIGKDSQNEAAIVAGHLLNPNNKRYATSLFNKANDKWW